MFFFAGNCPILPAKFLGVLESEDRAPFVMGNRAVILRGDDGRLKREGVLFKLIGLEKLYILNQVLYSKPSLEFFWSSVNDNGVFCFEAFFVAKPVAH